MYVYIYVYIKINEYAALYWFHKKIFSYKIDGQSLNRNRLWGTADDFKVMKVTKQNTVFPIHLSDIILVINSLTTTLIY